MEQFTPPWLQFVARRSRGGAAIPILHPSTNNIVRQDSKEPAMFAQTTTRLTHTVMIAAALAACFMVQHAAAAPQAATEAQAVVVLPRVVVTGKREAPQQIVHLERVTVIGKRVSEPQTMQARQQDTKGERVAMLVASR
jgi:organic hydroperoxide reductase OsmC/OhrA